MVTVTGVDNNEPKYSAGGDSQVDSSGVRSALSKEGADGDRSAGSSSFCPAGSDIHTIAVSGRGKLKYPDDTTNFYHTKPLKTYNKISPPCICPEGLADKRVKCLGKVSSKIEQCLLMAWRTIVWAERCWTK